MTNLIELLADVGGELAAPKRGLEVGAFIRAGNVADEGEKFKHCVVPFMGAELLRATAG